MIRSLSLLTSISILLIGCTGIKSFDGRIYSTGKSYFKVDCSDEVNNGKKNVKDIGYLCTVQISDETKLSDEKGTEINVDDFTTGSTVRVQLANSQNISKSKESREVEAKEIILLGK